MAIEFENGYTFLFICIGLLVIIALVFLTPSFYYIPKASLAAVILSAVLPMIEYDSFIPMWRVSSKSSDRIKIAIIFITQLI